MDDRSATNDGASQERIIRLLAQTQERLQRYVLVLLPDWDAAQEIVQNTHVVIWRKSAEFHSAADEGFYRWAKQIAYYEVKKYLAKQAAQPTLLDPETAALISEEFDALDDSLDERRQQLAACIEKLPPRDREVLKLRYWKEYGVAAVADRMGKTVDAIYKSLQRIRRSLLRCIQRETI